MNRSFALFFRALSLFLFLYSRRVRLQWIIIFRSTVYGRNFISFAQSQGVEKEMCFLTLAEFFFFFFQKFLIVNGCFLLQDKQEREEEERKTRIQLYVFVSRCVAYPFNSKQPTDMTKRQTKITKQQLEMICSRFQVNIKMINRILVLLFVHFE